jgi:hypothetical protein
MAKNKTQGYIKKFNDFESNMRDFLTNYEGLTFYESLLLLAAPKNQAILDERCIADDGTLEYMQKTSEMMLKDWVWDKLQVGDLLTSEQLKERGKYCKITKITKDEVEVDIIDEVDGRLLDKGRYVKIDFDNLTQTGELFKYENEKNDYTSSTQEEIKLLITAYTYLAEKGNQEAKQEIIILQKLITENPKFKIGDNVSVYDTSGTKWIYNAEIKFIDKDGYARLVTDTGFVISKVITNESKDVKLKIN